ncbi:MAG: FTR1 family protein [Deltaproteobacteria bacterium]|nr:FTR1 family protein [Deltaproteobacteria bacterium]
MAPPEQAALIAQLSERVAAKAPTRDVVAAARAARDALVMAHGLALAPTHRPSYPEGARLYAKNCALCHGEDGRGDTPKARELRPPPISFKSGELSASLTPYKVFNALSFGVAGTAMPSFRDTLDEAQLWSLAFYVLALRHAETAAEAPSQSPSLRRLATTTDSELSLPEAQLAYLRRVAAYQEDVDPFDTTRALLSAARTAAPEDAGRARDLAVDAYLTGFELAEGRVAAADRRLVQEIERGFLTLRAALVAGRVNEAQAKIDELLPLIDRAEDEAVGEKSSALAVAIAAAIIIVREGMEAALVVAAILAALSRLDSSRRRLRRFVHAGWAAAMVAGAGVWIAAGAATRLFASPEAAEGWMSLAAAAVLVYTGYWLVSQGEARRWVQLLRQSVRASGAALFALAFLAVFREAVETVLFFQSLLLHASGRTGAILAGAGAGSALLAALVVAVFALGKRLSSRWFFACTGVLLYGLAVVFAGRGIHALQVAGTLAPRPLAIPELPWLGMYGDFLSLGVQVALVAVFVLSAVGVRLALGRRQGSEPVS